MRSRSQAATDTFRRSTSRARRALSIPAAPPARTASPCSWITSARLVASLAGSAIQACACWSRSLATAAPCRRASIAASAISRAFIGRRPSRAGDLLARGGIDADAVADAGPGRGADREPHRLAVRVVLDAARGVLGDAEPVAVLDGHDLALDQHLLGAAGDEPVQLLLVLVAVVGHLVAGPVPPHAQRHGAGAEGARQVARGG